MDISQIKGFNYQPSYGSSGSDPGNLAFIEADGSLRPGHEVFNEFV